MAAVTSATLAAAVRASASASSLSPETGHRQNLCVDLTGAFRNPVCPVLGDSRRFGADVMWPGRRQAHRGDETGRSSNVRNAVCEVGACRGTGDGAPTALRSVWAHAVSAGSCGDADTRVTPAPNFLDAFFLKQRGRETPGLLGRRCFKMNAKGRRCYGCDTPAVSRVKFPRCEAGAEVARSR